MGEWRNRIVGYGEESPDQLLANPLGLVLCQALKIILDF